MLGIDINLMMSGKIGNSEIGNVCAVFLNYENQPGQDKNAKRKVIKHYFQGPYLGKGGNAKVYTFMDSWDNVYYAAKVFEKKNLLKPSR